MCSYLLSGTLYSAVPCIIYAMKNTFGWIGKAGGWIFLQNTQKGGDGFFFDLVRRGKTFFLRWFGRCFGRFFADSGL